jgi:hypothetical protein
MVSSRSGFRADIVVAMPKKEEPVDDEVHLQGDFQHLADLTGKSDYAIDDPAARLQFCDAKSHKQSR